MKRFILAALVTGALGTLLIPTPNVNADPPLSNCAAVLCLACPEGYVPAPTPGNCCRCVRA